MRAILSVLVLAAVATFGVGCQNGQRLVCEGKHFYFDVERVIFGIDYPHGQPESTHQKYYGIPDPGPQDLCVD